MQGQITSIGTQLGSSVLADKKVKMRDGQRCIIRRTLPDKGQAIVDIIAHGRVTAANQTIPMDALER